MQVRGATGGESTVFIVMRRSERFFCQILEEACKHHHKITRHSHQVERRRHPPLKAFDQVLISRKCVGRTVIVNNHADLHSAKRCWSLRLSFKAGIIMVARPIPHSIGQWVTQRETMAWSGYFLIVLYDTLIDGMAIANNPKLKVRSEQLYDLVVHLFVPP